MAIGFSALGICHTTPAEAAAAYWQSQPVTSIASSGQSNVFFLSYNIQNETSSIWQRQTFRCTQATNIQTCTLATVDLPTYKASTCSTNDPINNFTDGALMGWGVVAAMAVAWGVMAMRRAI